MVALPLRLRPVILLLGDSITQQGYGWKRPSGEPTVGWVALLARDYARRSDVLNRGYSGYNTKWFLQDALPGIISSRGANSQPVLFCTIFFGANDAALPGEAQYVPLEEYGRNLAAIVNYTREHLRPMPIIAEDDEVCTSEEPSNHIKLPLPIILFTPPPVDVDTWYKLRPPRPTKGSPKNDRANENAKAYGEVVKRVANETGCAVLDVFDLLGGNGSVDDFGPHLRDGLHLSESGNILVYEGLMDVLERDHPQLLPMTDGQGKYGENGVPLDGKLWGEFA